MKKKIEKGTPQALKDQWRTLYDSPKERMSRGAQNISKLISWARGENWRGKEEDIKQRHTHKKKK